MPVTRRFILGTAAGLTAQAPFARSLAAGHVAARSGASATTSTTRSDVLVLGAGLSGLNAALLLEDQGLSVTVLEGRERIGGRLLTFNDLPGAPEGGGSGISKSYARFLDLANRLGVKMVAERARTEPRENSALHIADTFIRLPDWAGHPANPHPEALRGLTPSQVIFGFLRERLPPMNLEDWQSGAYPHLDISVASFLAQQGLNDATIRLADKFSSYGTNLWQSSLLQLCHVFSFARHSAQLSEGSGPMSVAGGNQRMPEAMAGALRGDVLLGRQVEAIELNDSALNDHGVVVRCRDGSRHASRHLICSLPFSALRLVAVRPGFEGAQAEAVVTQPYHAAFQVHFAIRKPFWERDGLPPSFWSDGPLERFNALNYGPDGAISSFMHYSNGDSAARFDRMPPDAAAQLLLAELERIRPATRGALRPLRVWSWQQTPFSGGAYASWAPGQIPRFAQAARAPHRQMHLCGEHTSILARGMEGALESGERAALEVLQHA